MSLRQEMPEQAPEKRIKNFNEVALGYTKEQAIAESIRCLECKNPQCVKGCPVNIDIPAFIGKMKNSDFDAAIDIIKATNSLPAVCGRVCPQETQCEKYCILAKKDQPVAIGRLERFCADYELVKGVKAPERKPSDRAPARGPCPRWSLRAAWS